MCATDCRDELSSHWLKFPYAHLGCAFGSPTHTVGQTSISHFDEPLKLSEKRKNVPLGVQHTVSHWGSDS